MTEPILFSEEEIKSLISITNPNKTDKTVPTGDLMSYLASCMREWTKVQQQEALSSIDNKETSSPYYKILIDLYQADKHIEITRTHREFIIKTYNRLKVYFPTVTMHQLEIHDLSKLNFKQIVGYTKKFVHFCPWEDEIWQDALQDHYLKEDHHPDHDKDVNMSREYLEESVIDMLACHWERDLNGKPDVDNYELANIDGKFLNRYRIDDKKEVMEIFKKIQMGNNSN